MSIQEPLSGETTRRSFLSRLMVLVAAGVGFGSLDVLRAATAEAASEQWFSVPNFGYVYCSKGSCHYGCEVYGICSGPPLDVAFKRYRNVTGASRSCYGRVPGYCTTGYNLCYKTPQWWMTYITQDNCCVPSYCI